VHNDLGDCITCWPSPCKNWQRSNRKDRNFDPIRSPWKIAISISISMIVTALSLTLSLFLTLNLSVGLFHIKKSATSINMKEPQPHVSQNQIIKPSDYRYFTKRTQTELRCHLQFSRGIFLCHAFNNQVKVIIDRLGGSIITSNLH